MQQRQLIEVDPKRIKFNPLNPRKHRGTELIRLRASIKSVGIVQLPTVRVLPGGFYEVIDGEGRVSIAQEEGFEKIWVVSVGIIDEQEALMMLQSANTMRSYNFIAECKGLANLYRQKNTIVELSKSFSISASKAGVMVAVGFFPPQTLGRIENHIIRADEQSNVWSYSLFDHVLPLRELLHGKNTLPSKEWFPLDDIYDYTEVDKAIENVICGEITSEEKMHTYVVGRKYEIYQARFNQDLQKQLEENLSQARQELAVAKEREVQQQIGVVQEEMQGRYSNQIIVLQCQIDELKKSQEKIVNDVVKRPEIVKQREKELRETIQKTEIERQRLSDLQQELETQALKERIRLEKENAHFQEVLAVEMQKRADDDLREEREGLEEARKKLEVEQKKQIKEAEHDLKEYYAQKDQKRQVKAENTIQGLLSHAVKSLAESQQIVEHIISGGMLQGVQQLGGAQHESLLWAMRSMQESLDRAEARLTYGDVVLQVEGELNGHKS